MQYKTGIIDRMRLQGKSYLTIAEQLNMSVSTVKAYCKRHPVSATRCDNKIEIQNDNRSSTCRQCGVEIKQNIHKRERLYCSDSCREKWWKEHLGGKTTDRRCLFICPICGRRFIAYGQRKYCSYKCHGIAMRLKKHE